MPTVSEFPTNFLLNNGLRMPSVGLGTFQGDKGNGSVKEIVLLALEEGYRHIDTASGYGNEKEIGDALLESGIPRDEVFITTKLDQNWHEPSYVEAALEQSLAKLQLEYVDLFLMHFPHAYCTSGDRSKLRQSNGKPVIDCGLSRRYPEVWQAMESLVKSGKAKSIGLSNFNILKTRRILEVAEIRPAVNQIEIHPYLPQPDLLHFCNREKIHVVAHQPLGGNPLSIVNPNSDRPGPLFDRRVASIAVEYGKTPAQTILSWNLMRGVSIIPKTVRKDRLVENVQLFRLNDEHFDRISSLSDETGTVRYLDPKDYIGFDIFDETEDQPVEQAFVYK